MTNRQYFAFARHALVGALRELNARSGDSIAVPELICRDVLASFHHVGVKPAFYPVARDLTPTADASDKEATFVLMVNYFGFPQKVETFRTLWPNSPIVEDNAHGFLSRSPSNQELGTRTEAGITSCRKTLRIPDGAWMYSAKGSATSDHSMVVDRPTPLGFTTRTMAARIERSTGLPVNTALRTTIRICRQILTGSTLPQSQELSEFELPDIVQISQKSFDAITNVDATREVSRRRELFMAALEFATMRGIEPIYSSLPEGTSPYGFPFYSSHPVTAMSKFARRHHCEVINWPDLPTAVSVAASHHYRQLRIVNFL
jgi:hypothetical protein